MHPPKGAALVAQRGDSWTIESTACKGSETPDPSGRDSVVLVDQAAEHSSAPDPVGRNADRRHMEPIRRGKTETAMGSVQVVMGLVGPKQPQQVPPAGDEDQVEDLGT